MVGWMVGVEVPGGRKVAVGWGNVVDVRRGGVDGRSPGRLHRRQRE